MHVSSSIVVLCLGLIAVSLAVPDKEVRERKKLNPKDKGLIKLANKAIKQMGPKYKVDKIYEGVKEEFEGDAIYFLELRTKKKVNGKFEKRSCTLLVTDSLESMTVPEFHCHYDDFEPILLNTEF